MAHMNVLLIEDVDQLGRSGEITKVKPGFARNFLLPQGKAVVADKGAVRRQKKLQEERAKKAAQDRKDAEILAQKLATLVISTELKCDPEGKPYGSVAAQDVVQLLHAQHGIELDRRCVAQKQHIKAIGAFDVPLRLNEGVEATLKIEIAPEGGVIPQPQAAEEGAEEAPAEESQEG